MTLSLILAKSRNHVIGRNNQLPWHLPADLKHFKEITMGKPIIMGRKTADSIGKSLPGRQNIIITRNKSFHRDGYDVFHSIHDALESVKHEKEIMIIGGTDLFLQTLLIADTIYLTLIDADFEGDAFFPELDSSKWRLDSEKIFIPDEKNKYYYRFQVYKRCCTK